MQSPVENTITVGDLMQRVAADASKKLLSMMEAMPAQTPELRFEKMKACVARLKKQLCQLLALLMWLRDDNVQKYLRSMQAMTQDIRRRNAQLDGVQDAFFFLHQSIYKRRRQALDVSFASDIMARGTYAHLPESIFDFGAESSDKCNGGMVFRDTAETNMFIGCKLCLGDPVPEKIDVVVVQDGKLMLRKNNYFEISLTLAAASELAHWVVEEVDFTVEHCTTEGFIDSYAHTQLEDNVKNALNSLVRHKSDNPLENMAADKSILSTICSLCQHVALSVHLKLLYLQALYNSRHLSEGYSSTIYSENDESFILEYAFWAHSKARSLGYPYLVRVSLSRVATAAELQLELFRVLDPVSQGAPPVQIEIPFAQHKKDTILSSLTSSGASFPAALSAVLSICAEERLRLVFTVLSRSSSLKHPFTVHIDDMGQCITIKKDNVECVRVCVCSLTGKFIVADTYVSWGVVKGAKACMTQFLGELNGIIMDFNVKRVKSIDDAVVRLRGVEFKTVSKLLRYLLLFDEQSDFEILCGQGKSIPVLWMERLSRHAGLENSICAMYTLSRSRENFLAGVSKKLSYFDILTTFVIAIDSEMAKSYFIISSCVGCEKNDVPVFGELFKLSGSSGRNDISMRDNPLVFLLKSKELIQPTVLCDSVSMLCHIRVAVHILSSKEKTEVLLQRQRLHMVDLPFTENITRTINNAEISVDSSKPWEVDQCSGLGWCAVHRATKSVFFLVNILSVGSGESYECLDQADVLSDLIKCNFVPSLPLARDRRWTAAPESSSVPGFLDVLRPYSQDNTSVSAELIRSQWLVVKCDAYDDQAGALSTHSSLIDSLSSLRGCIQIANDFCQFVLAPFQQHGSSISSTISCDITGKIATTVRPLETTINFIDTSSSEAETVFCTAKVTYSVLLGVSALSASQDLEPLDMVCYDCAGPGSGPVRNLNHLNFLSFCESLLNFSLERHSECYHGADKLANMLAKAASGAYAACHLAWCLEMQLMSISSPENNCIVSYSNVLSSMSYSVVLTSNCAEDELIALFDVDISLSSTGGAAEYSIRSRIGGNLESTGGIFTSSDSVSTAKYMLTPLSPTV